MIQSALPAPSFASRLNLRTVAKREARADLDIDNGASQTASRRRPQVHLHVQADERVHGASSRARSRALNRGRTLQGSDAHGGGLVAQWQQGVACYF